MPFLNVLSQNGPKTAQNKCQLNKTYVLVRDVAHGDEVAVQGVAGKRARGKSPLELMDISHRVYEPVGPQDVTDALRPHGPHQRVFAAEYLRRRRRRRKRVKSDRIGPNRGRYASHEKQISLTGCSSAVTMLLE